MSVALLALATIAGVSSTATIQAAQASSYIHVCGRARVDVHMSHCGCSSLHTNVNTQLTSRT